MVVTRCNQERDKLSVVHSRLEDKDIKTLDQLAKVRGASRSQLIREAVKMYLATWTGEPDINDIQKRLREVESRVNVLEAKLGGL